MACAKDVRQGAAKQTYPCHPQSPYLPYLISTPWALAQENENEFKAVTRSQPLIYRALCMARTRLETNTTEERLIAQGYS